MNKYLKRLVPSRYYLLWIIGIFCFYSVTIGVAATRETWTGTNYVGWLFQPYREMLNLLLGPGDYVLVIVTLMIASIFAGFAMGFFVRFLWQRSPLSRLLDR